MATLNELKWQALSNETGLLVGKLNELEYTWLQAKYPLFVGHSLNELWAHHLRTQGYSGTIGEMQWAALEDLGYEGNWNEKFYQYWGDLAGGGGERFIVTNLEYQNNIVSAYTSLEVTSTTGVGWELIVNGVQQAMVVDSFGVGGIIFLTEEIPIGSSVFMNYYDGVGDTLNNATPLEAIGNFPVKESPSTFTFAAAGSLHLFTDGAIQNRTLLDVAAGIGPVDYSNDGLTLPDHEGVYHTDKAGTPPWYGARKATNTVEYSRAMDPMLRSSQGVASPPELIQANYTEYNGVPMHLWRFATNGAGGTDRSKLSPLASITMVNGEWWNASVYLGLVNPPVGGEAIELLTANTYRITNIPLDQTIRRYSVNGQYGGSTTTQGKQFELWLRGSTHGNTTLDVLIGGPQAELMLGANVQNPSDWIPTDGSTPESRWFDNENGNTVLNNVVTEADGPTIDPYPKLYCAPSLLNRQTRSYKLAFWTTQGIGGVDQDNYTGLEGIVGKASRLTDADPGSYFACTSNITINATAQVTTQWAIRKQASQTAWPGLGNAGGNGYSASYIAFNQVTGAYNVLAGSFDKIIVDGSNPEWWFVTLQVPNVGSPFPQKIWAALSIDGTTLSGSAQGFVDVGYAFCSEEVDADRVKASVPILTNGTAVNQAPSYVDYPQANHADDQGAYFCEGTLTWFNGGSDSLIGVGSSGRLMYWSATANQNTFDGTNARTVSSPWVEGVMKKVGNAYGATEGLNRLTVDGVSQEGAYDGSWNPTLLRAGGYHAIISPRVNSVALIGNIRRYNLPYTEAKAKIDELMGILQIAFPDLTLTAGDSGGTRVGFNLGVYGSVTPDQTTLGDAINALFINNSNGRVRFKVQGEYAPDAFTSMEIVGVGTLLASNAVYDYDGVETEYRWNSTGLTLVSGTTYAVDFL